MLADDLKALRGVDSRNEADIDKITLWCDKWLMTLNATKCKVLHAESNNQKFTYQLALERKDTLLESSEVERHKRDLGIYTESDPLLNFDRHIQEVMSRSPAVIKKLYTSLVRPHLEYCSQALILRKK
jgi:hypothetical protein